MSNTTENHITIEKIRRAGHKVRVSHYRYAENSRNHLLPIREVPKGKHLGKGGKTVVEITLKDGRELKG